MFCARVSLLLVLQFYVIHFFIYFFCFIFLLIPQSFICLFIVDIVVVLLSSLREIMSLVPRKP